MAETVYEKLNWLLELIEQGKKGLEGILAENAQLRGALPEVERQLAAAAPHRTPAERMAEVEAQYDSLSNLFVAALQLHSAWTGEGVMVVLKELLINFVGATKFELYLTQRSGALASIGLQSFKGRPPPGSNTAQISESLRSGRVEALEDFSGAVAPIFLGARTVGALVVTGLLPHKRRLGSGDLEMLHLISEQLGPVLLRAHLFERTGQAAPADDASLSMWVE